MAKLCETPRRVDIGESVEKLKEVCVVEQPGEFSHPSQGQHMSLRASDSDLSYIFG